MNTSNEILRQVLFYSHFSVYWKQLGILLICLLLFFQICVLFTLILEFIRKKRILTRKLAVSGENQASADINLEFERLWKEIFPLVFDENGIPRPRREVKLRKLFRYIRRMQQLNPKSQSELEKLSCLMKNAEYYQKRKFPVFDWKFIVLIHLLVALIAVVIFYFQLSSSTKLIVLYILSAECIALFFVGYFKLFLAFFAVPESLNLDFVHPFIQGIYFFFRNLPKGLVHIGNKSSEEMFQWVGKEFEKSRKSVVVMDENRNVIRVEDDTDRQMIALICLLFFFMIAFVIALYFLILWFYLFGILCVFCFPFIVFYYFFRNYVFYGRFQRILGAAVIFCGASCTVFGGVLFYSAWQQKAEEMIPESKKETILQSNRSLSEVSVQSETILTPQKRTDELITLLDAFPQMYRARVLKFHKISGRDFWTVAVDYQVEITKELYKNYLVRFRKKLSELGFSPGRESAGNSIQIIYNGPESASGIYYFNPQNLVCQNLFRYYEKKALLCRFDFMDKNGRVRFSRTVLFGMPILFTEKRISLYPPQNNQLSRTARMQFQTHGSETALEVDHIQLTLTYATLPPGVLKESRESIRYR